MHEIYIYDDIGEDWFGGVSAKSIISQIEAHEGEELTVRINSPGGDVFEGVAIHNALQRREGKTILIVDALAASIASVIMLAGDEVRMADGSMVMVHNPWTVAGGNADDFRRHAEILDQVRDSLVEIYANRIEDREQLINWLDAETWFSADEAIAAGFADSKEESGLQVAASLVQPGRYRNTPPQLLTAGAAPRKAPAWKQQARERRLRLLKAR